jgi:voltage-gated potassium channel
MIRPAVVTFLDMMLRERDRILRFEEIRVPENSHVVGKTIQECKIKEKTGALLVALRDKKTGEYHFNPPEETEITAEDTLVLIASPEMVKAIEEKIV